MEIKEIMQEMTLEEKASLCSGLDYWHTKPVDRLGVPSMMMCDGPHGLRKQTAQTDHLGVYGSTQAVCFPSGSALAASFDRAVLARLGETLGAECRAEGVGMLLGPGLNIKRSPLCGRNFEYYSEDPYLTGELAVSYIRALQGSGTAACVKHFACNNQETDRMTVDSVVGTRAFREIYLPAFEKAVKEGKTRAVMCAYNSLNGRFCSENKGLLTDILRQEWKYGGMVVTDWGAVKDRIKGLLAGLDLEMPGGPGAQDAKIAAAVRSGQLQEAVLDQAVEKVLNLVFACFAAESDAMDYAADHRTAVELAEECMVLLQNEDGLLPLKPSDAVAWIGAFARNPRYQGAGSSRVNPYRVESALDAAERRECNIRYAQGYSTDGSEDERLLREAVCAAREAKAAVIFAGLPDSFETEGCDRESLDLPENQNLLISEIAKVQPNTIVVLHTGAPVRMPWKENVKSILLAYLGGEGVGEAVTAALFGEVNPSGKLAETFPLRLEDTPAFLDFPGELGKVTYHEDIFVGYRYYEKRKIDVLFPFGHGLSYTSFSYDNLSLSREILNEGELLEVSCTVKNTGSVKGKEAVQLYVGAENSAVRRPVRELRGFEKIELMPGQEKTVRFRLRARDFAYYNARISDWFVESGSFRIEIGTSSRNLPLAATVTVRGKKPLPVHFDRLTPSGMVWQRKAGQDFLTKVIVQSKHLSWNEEGSGVGEQDRETFDAVLSSLVSIPIGSLIAYGAAGEEEIEALLAKLNEG